MRVAVYPADQYGCGHHRLIWPSQELINAGHDIDLVTPKNRHLRLSVDNRNDTIVDVDLPDGVDVIVLQRVTHRYLAEVVPIIRAKDVAVVIDVDDDLAAIHPANPAWHDLHPNRKDHVVDAQPRKHSWHNLADACRAATLVTTTTPALQRRYAPHGRGVVLPNYLAEHYYGVDHEDNDVVGWPASLHSHPDDPAAVGNAIQRLVHDGARFRVASQSPGVGAAFGLVDDDQVELSDYNIELLDWPAELTKIGIGVAPLADTRFNAGKSWLKALELAAVGVPWVASPREDYSRLHKLGCGLLVEKPKAWYAVLRDLLRSETRRRELSDAGRVVAEQLRLANHAWRWWEAWDHALGLQRRRDVAQVVVG